MKKMNETELKVVLLVTRKTLGWFDPMSRDRKIQDYISQSQFIEFTGQGNKAIARAIQSCVEHGWIIAKDKNGNICASSDKRARRRIWYQLGNIFTDKISSGVQMTPESGVQKSTHLVSKGHSTKETIYTKENNILPARTSQEPISLESGTFSEKAVKAEKKPNPLFSLLQWASERRGSDFANKGKQLAAIKRMKVAKIGPESIKERWIELENNSFYEDKGFDFVTIANSFDRKR